MAEQEAKKEIQEEKKEGSSSSSSNRPVVTWPFQQPEFWSKVESILTEPITEPSSLAKVIQEIWKAKHPHGTRTGPPHSATLVEFLEDQKRRRKEFYDFFFDVLPRVQKLVLKFPILFTEPTPQLLQGDTQEVVLTQEACACVVANIFFGTVFSPQTYIEEDSQPNLHFHGWFDSDYCIPYVHALVHYLARIGGEMPSGKVSFRRNVVKKEELPDWDKSEAILSKPLVNPLGTIEDSGCTLQADFANEFIGGGIIRGARAQEEILFCFRPECFVSLALFSRMLPNEAIVIKGAERFSTFKGYGGTLQFAGNYEDDTPRDEQGFRKIEIVCFDAVVAFYTNQYSKENIDRDILKAYAAFTPGHSSVVGLPGEVATGNWGCGAFGGDKRLKFLEQLIAAAQSGRSLQYFTFGETDITDQLTGLLPYFEDTSFSVSKLYNALIQVCKEHQSLNSKVDLFAFIVQKLQQ